MYRLNVQVTAYGRQTVPDRGVVRSCDPLKFWGLQSYHWNGEPKVVEFCTQVGDMNSSNRVTYHPQKGWLWSRDCFKHFAVCRDVARRAGSSATAELLVLNDHSDQKSTMSGGRSFHTFTTLMLGFGTSESTP